MPVSEMQMIQLVLIAVMAFALLLQTIFLVVGLIIASRAIRSIRKEMEDYRSTIQPVIEKARDVVEKISPKIEATAGELSEIAKSLRTQTADIKSAADEIIGRTRNQASRIDSMLTIILDRVEHAGTVVSDTVAKPMRQLSGLIASVRAAVDALRVPPAPHARTAHAASPHPAGDELLSS